MPPLGAAITAALVSAGASATVAAVASGVITTVLSSALSFGLSAIFAKKPKQTQSEIGQEFQQTAGGEREHYGRVLMGAAARLFWGHDGEGKLYKLVVFASGGVSSINNVWLDGEPVTLDGSGFVTDDKYQSSKVGSHAQIITTLGEDDQTVISEFNAAFPSEWTSDHRARGHALMGGIFERAKGEQLNSMYPRADAPDFAIDGNGREIFDSRDGSTAFSENPVLQLQAYLKTPHGGGFVDDDFDQDEWEAAADVCDEAVALKAGGTEARYRCALTRVSTDDRSEVIGRFLKSFAGQMRELPDGKIGVRAGKWRTPTVTILQEHLVAIESADADDTRTSYSKRISTFLDPLARFTETTTTPFVDADLLDRLGDVTVSDDRQQVPSGTQCARLDKIQMAFDNPARMVTLTLRFVGLQLMDEESLILNLPDRGYENTPMWVDSWSASEDFSTFTVVLRTAEATSFDWDAATEEPSQPLVLTLPGQTGGVPDMAGLVVSVTRGTIGSQSVPRLVASWTDEPSYQAVCQFSPAGDNNWQNMVIQASGTRAEVNVLDETVDYDVRVFWSLDPSRTTEPEQSGSGVAQTEDDIVVVANGTAPSAPTVVSSTTASFVQTVSFTPDAGANYFRTIARQTGTTIELASDFASGGDNSLTFPLNESTQNYEILSENSSGVESAATSLGPLTGPSGV